MQLRYIDHTDFEHLVNTLIQDFKPLSNRIKKIEQSVERTFGTIKNRRGVKNEIWESPISKNLWSIYYLYAFRNNKMEIEFYPITEFSSSAGEKEFLLLSRIEKLNLLGSKLTSLSKINDPGNKTIFKEYLVKNNLFLIIFRGHFIDRFRKRTSKSDYTNFEIMMEFSINPNLVLVDNFQQNQDWLMYLHSNGIAMIKHENNYIVFDTFVATKELKETQRTAILNHLNTLDNRTYGAVVFLLLDGDEWIEYIDKERLLKWLIIITTHDRKSAKELIDNNLPALTILFGQSFHDDYLANKTFN